MNLRNLWIGLVWPGCLALALAGAGLGAETAATAAGDGGAAEKPVTPPRRELAGELRDPAFEQFVSLTLLSQAVLSGDPDQLADAAILLQHGEQVLGRTHDRGIRSELVFERAVSLAASGQRTGVLDRLDKIAESRGLATWKQQIDLVRKLHAGKRAPTVRLVLDLDRFAAEELLGVRATVLAIGEAKATGDVRWLDAIRLGIEELASLEAAQKRYLQGLIDEAKQAAEQIPDPELLRRLAGVSRDAKDLADYHRSMADINRSHGEVLKGGAEFIKAQGQFAADAASARLMDQDTLKKSYENEQLRSSTFWAKRRTYLESRQKRRIRSSYDLARLASQRAPQALPETVSWPHLLTLPALAQRREQLEVLLAARSEANSGVGSENCYRIQILATELEYSLKQEIRNVSPMEYVSAQQFLKSVKYAATQPLGQTDTPAADPSLVAKTPGGPAKPRRESRLVTTLKDPLDADGATAKPKTLTQLTKAWRDLVPKEVVDSAVELGQEAQRFALPDRADLADEVYRIAVQLSLMSHEAKLLQRLEKAAGDWKRNDLTSLAKRAMELDAQQPGTVANVSLESVPLESIVLYRAYLADLRASVLVGDSKMREGLMASVATAPLTPEQKEQLSEIAMHASASPQLAPVNAWLWKTLEPRIGDRVVLALEAMSGLRESLPGQLERDFSPARPNGLPIAAATRSLDALYEKLAATE